MTLDRPCIKKDHALRNKSKNLTVRTNCMTLYKYSHFSLRLRI